MGDKDPDDVGSFYGGENFMELFCIFPFVGELMMRGGEFDDEGTVHTMGIPGELQVSMVFSEEEDEDEPAWFNKRERFHDIFLGNTMWDMVTNFGFHILPDGRTEVYHQGGYFRSSVPGLGLIMRTVFSIHARWVAFATRIHLNNTPAFVAETEEEEELEEFSRSNMPFYLLMHEFKNIPGLAYDFIFGWQEPVTYDFSKGEVGEVPEVIGQAGSSFKPLAYGGALDEEEDEDEDDGDFSAADTGVAPSEPDSEGRYGEQWVEKEAPALVTRLFPETSNMIRDKIAAQVAKDMQFDEKLSAALAKAAEAEAKMVEAEARANGLSMEAERLRSEAKSKALARRLTRNPYADATDKPTTEGENAYEQARQAAMARFLTRRATRMTMRMTKSAGTEIGNEVDVATGLIESPQAAVVTTPVVSAPTESITVTEVVVDEVAAEAPAVVTTPVVSAPTESITVTEVVVDEVAAEAPAVLAVEETKTTDSIKNLVSEKVEMMEEVKRQTKIAQVMQMMREAEALRAEKLFLENEKLKAALSKMEK